MTRGNDPGKDFNDQFNESFRRGREKADRGEGPWAEDKYLERVNRRLSGPPANHRKGSGGCALAFLGGFILTAALVADPAEADVYPTVDSCYVLTNTSAPKGDCGPFRQVFRDTFPTTVPLGKFKDCEGEGSFRCAGLAAYPTVQANWGAYPNGWADTATSGADGNGGRTFGGYYRPQSTISVYKASNGDGQMRVKMYRPAVGGSIRSAAVVPRKCMNLRYGKFTERFVVRTATNGYKMAHLHYTPDEIDYPEAGGNFKSDPVSWFTHGFTEDGNDVAANSAWTKWHTYSTEITPGLVRFYLDGKLVGTAYGDNPRAGDWILQNEAALAGGYAAKGSSVVIDTTWVTCYKLGD
jgi:hypothetical protein